MLRHQKRRLPEGVADATVFYLILVGVLLAYTVVFGALRVTIPDGRALDLAVVAPLVIASFGSMWLTLLIRRIPEGEFRLDYEIVVLVILAGLAVSTVPVQSPQIFLILLNIVGLSAILVTGMVIAASRHRLKQRVVLGFIFVSLIVPTASFFFGSPILYVIALAMGGVSFVPAPYLAVGGKFEGIKKQPDYDAAADQIEGYVNEFQDWLNGLLSYIYRMGWGPQVVVNGGLNMDQARSYVKNLNSSDHLAAVPEVLRLWVHLQHLIQTREFNEARGIPNNQGIAATWSRLLELQQADTGVISDFMSDGHHMIPPGVTAALSQVESIDLQINETMTAIAANGWLILPQGLTIPIWMAVSDQDFVDRLSSLQATAHESGVTILTSLWNLLRSRYGLEVALNSQPVDEGNVLSALQNVQTHLSSVKNEQLLQQSAPSGSSGNSRVTRRRINYT